VEGDSSNQSCRTWCNKPRIGTRGGVEVVMRSDWNENSYSQQFEGDLHGRPESLPVHVTTNLRMMDEDTAREVRKYQHPDSGMPQYVFETNEDLPEYPNLRAVGRHYFKW
jgi:hypothetical protein